MNRAERTKVLRFGASGLLATGLHVIVAMTLIVRAGTEPALANGP